GGSVRLNEALVRSHEQVAFRLPPEAANPIVTLSGGVGALVYAHVQGKPWPSTTHYGDLCIDLAQRIPEAPNLAEHWKTYIPPQAGRATLFGLLLHTTQVSGSTIFLPRPEALPLCDLPIFGTIATTTDQAHCVHVLDLVRRSPSGGCIQVETGPRSDDV